MFLRVPPEKFFGKVKTHGHFLVSRRLKTNFKNFVFHMFHVHNLAAVVLIAFRLV